MLIQVADVPFASDSFHRLCSSLLCVPLASVCLTGRRLSVGGGGGERPRYDVGRACERERPYLNGMDAGDAADSAAGPQWRPSKGIHMVVQ